MQVLDTDTLGRTLADCRPGSYLNATSSLCVACPAGKLSSPGATSAGKCYCPPGVFTNCALNEMLVEHAPHSVYVGEAWNASTNTLRDLSGNGRHAVLTVVPSTGRQRQG